MRLWPAQRAYRPIRLGNAIEAELAQLGITKQWYCSLKEQFGLPPVCDCERRREWLNQVSNWWQITPDEATTARAGNEPGS